MGRGIVEPVDVMDNEPWSQDLLDWLAYDFVQNGYDIKKADLYDHYVQNVSIAVGGY
jgi:hypothetical protein